MRITNQMLSSSVLTNLNRDLQGLQKAQNQMSSGQTVSQPSDDPVATSRILSLQSTISAQERYAGNLTDAENFLKTSETALSNFNSALSRVRELMLQGATGTMTASDRQSAGEEVDQIINQLVEIGNSMCGSQYVFGGSNTNQPPLSRVGDVVTYNGNDKQINYEVSQGVQMQVNIDGSSLFQQVVASTGEGNTDIFNTLVEIKNDLMNDTNITDLGGDLLNKIDSISDHISSAISVIGARSNRVDAAKIRIQNDQNEATKILSSLQDVDLAKATVDYSERYYAYQAALSTAARVLPKSLVDYLD